MYGCLVTLDEMCDLGITSERCAEEDAFAIAIYQDDDGNLSVSKIGPQYGIYYISGVEIMLTLTRRDFEVLGIAH